MSLVIGDNFQFLGSKPLDSRLTFSTLADMVAMADSTLYSGIIAYCVGEDKNYQWKSTNEVDETLGKWREFQSGGGNHETMSESDVDDIKNSVEIREKEIPEVMSQSDVEDIKDAFEIEPSKSVTSFNGRSGHVNPMDGDYSDDKIILSSFLHIGGETQEKVSEALQALAEHGGGGGGDHETMSQADVDDIMDSVEINAMDVPQVMSRSDVEDIKRAFKVDPGEGMPIGTIIEFLGMSSPNGYLECDGSVYNISDYALLADHIKTQFGSYDYFGGDGVTTFGIPNKAGQNDSIYCICSE